MDAQQHQQYLQDRKQRNSEEWVRKMGMYTDRTYEDVRQNIYFDKWCANKKKTMTLEERFIISKVNELCWGHCCDPLGVAGGHWRESRPDFTQDANGMEIEIPGSIVYPDSGRTFEQWVQYRKDNKIRTII
jgi:hypothetical protein